MVCYAQLILVVNREYASRVYLVCGLKNNHKGKYAMLANPSWQLLVSLGLRRRAAK